MNIVKWIRNLAKQELEEQMAGILKIEDRVIELEREITDLSRTASREIERIRILSDEIDQRIERGNKIWRAIRAREVRATEREELEGELDADQGVLPLYADGSGEVRMPNLPHGVEDPDQHLAPYERFARDFARQVASGG